MQADELERAVRRAAETIAAAEALVFAAGAGLGVDSGLPDFRGNEGFWRAYPPFRARGLSFVELANPASFASNPAQAWGFYGHRLHLYRETCPHVGFDLMRRWGEAKPGGYFVFTSNVDGHFQRAGFDAERIVECHGSIHHLQCSLPCWKTIWAGDDLRVEIDRADFRAREPLPRCPRCGMTARPNVLMFHDYDWLGDRSSAQSARYWRWLTANRRARIAIVECGAGNAVPTVRHHCERLPGTLIRINPRDYEVPPGGISIPLGAREAIERICEVLS